MPHLLWCCEQHEWVALHCQVHSLIKQLTLDDLAAAAAAAPAAAAAAAAAVNHCLTYHMQEEQIS
jgi:hypothetical protein